MRDRCRNALGALFSLDVDLSNPMLYLPIGLLVVLILLMIEGRPSAQDREAARALVQQTYQAARTGQDTSYGLALLEWQTANATYGRVCSFQIRGERADFPFRNIGLARLTLELEVQRERTRTHERAHVTAGTSPAYGYQTGWRSLEVLPVTPRR